MPICVQHALALGTDTSYSAAAERFLRLRNRKNDRLIHIGQAQLNRTGRPADVYYNGEQKWKKDNLRHEIKISDYQIAFPEHEFLRGTETGARKEDFIQIVNGVRLSGELDCNTMPKKKVIERWMKYADYDGKILVVVAPKYGWAKDRIIDLINWAEEAGDFNDKAYYVPLDSILKDPKGKLWIDCTSHAYSLETLLEKP